MEEVSNRVPIDVQDGPTDITELAMPKKQSQQLDEEVPISDEHLIVNGGADQGHAEENACPAKVLMVSDLWLASFLVYLYIRGCSIRCLHCTDCYMH